MNFLDTHNMAKALSVTPQTLRNWHKSGQLIPHHVGKGGHRYYTQAQVAQVTSVKNPEREVIGYIRVSSSKQKDDLERQAASVRSYLARQGQPFRIIEDIGSGINYKKKGLKELIQLVVSRKVSKIVILYKDRLLRFGFELLEYVCELFDTTIEIIDRTPKVEQQELVEDLVQIITVFSCRLQGKRANKAKTFIKEVKADD